jgi:hypothetical protein
LTSPPPSGRYRRRRTHGAHWLLAAGRSDGITPSGSVGSGKDSDIRDLLFGVVEPRCGDDIAARSAIGHDYEVDRQAVVGPRLGRPNDGHQRSSGSNRTRTACSNRSHEKTRLRQISSCTRRNRSGSDARRRRAIGTSDSRSR